jgi:hypothetical protein
MYRKETALTESEWAIFEQKWTEDYEESRRITWQLVPQLPKPSLR